MFDMLAQVSATHAYFIPGMFGFGRLAGFDYFCHLEAALQARFTAAGRQLETRIVSTPPTASLRRRARALCTALQQSGDHDAEIVLVGHSTGGLDARLLLTPGVDLDLTEADRRRLERIRAVAMLNTPHHGSPLASFFTTASGTRLLYVASLLTVASLTLSQRPLTAFAGLVATVEALDGWLGTNIRLLDDVTQLGLRVFGESSRTEVAQYMASVRGDQGGIVQLMPEAMDLFNAAVSDRPSVRYGSVVTSAPAPRASDLATAFRNPVRTLSTALYATFHTVTAQRPAAYSYPRAADAVMQGAKVVTGATGPAANDGVVPTQSQLWGQPIWSGQADHLDVVGHFEDDEAPALHTDWLASGAGFGRRDHAALCDALARFLLA